MRPVLLGMNNPHREGDPLSPDATAGRRLFGLSGLSRETYLEAFERVNLIDARQWCPGAAREAAQRLRSRVRGRQVLVLGRLVWQALGLPRGASWLAAVNSHGAHWTLVPHPSGRNLILNDKAMRLRVRRCLMRSSRSRTR